ncbi:ABC transporter G family member 23-like isoform X4 [Diabrotica virgifera virgifera]|nr:ABC transporter G family member 23-like isoform X4 [Diabrotica virgifera virgifera]XP_050499820.1 ABC transporter G family member 23-like isoform X4 [Diabrotica virgifera virgifera]XP_050499821.1 ABC transporter G family member 23-like isoform X4 [Diabrotica virgifera virgifera]
MHDNYAVYVDRVVKKYGQKEILSGLSMKVERGVIYGLLGSSGCGKTTLLNSIVGRNKIDGGEVWVLGGKPGQPGSGVPGPRVGYMPQNIALVGEFTVQDAIYYFGRIFLMDEDVIATRYRELHKLLELPPNDRYLKNCSGGQQRRVSLAVALVHNPELVIMDEPTVGMDAVLRERIWNHLVKITREGTSVIVTTHYIEECRQANKIALMRDGILLTEESPTRLLTLFNSETLEQVFLQLSQQQEAGNLTGLPELIEEVQNIRLQQNGGSVSNTSINEIVRQSTEVLTKKQILKTKDALSRTRMKALLDKNWKQFYRNVTGVLFLLTFPILTVVIFMGVVGGDALDTPLGIVNNEAMTITCPNFSKNGTAFVGADRYCHFKNLSCRFLTYLDDPMIKKIQFNNLEEAKDAVVHGKIIGAMYMDSNFTSYLNERIENGRYADSETLSLSEIKVWMDMSNRQIGAALKYKLLNLYSKFQNELFDDCQYTHGNMPLKFDFFYGRNDEPFILFMIPACLITIMFFMGSMMTSQIIITERHEGIWDRSIVAGVTSLEITLTHIVLQASVCVIQTIEALFVAYLYYKHEFMGNMVLMFFLIYLSGICGISYGFWISVVSVNHLVANLVITGMFFPMMSLCGLMWPIEGMPLALRFISKCTPVTIPIESFRNVFKKGWTLDNFEVYNGICVALFWTLFFAVLSVITIKRKR